MTFHTVQDFPVVDRDEFAHQVVTDTDALTRAPREVFRIYCDRIQEWDWQYGDPALVAEQRRGAQDGI